MGTLKKHPSFRHIILLAVGALAPITGTSMAQNLFVANNNDGTILNITTNGVISTFSTQATALPYALAFNKSGILFASFDDGFTGKILKYSSNGTASTFTTNVVSPSALAFNSSGTLFVADDSANAIYAFTTNGTRSTFATNLNTPYALAFNSSGTLFEADYGSGNIYKFATNGTLSTFATNLITPSALAFDSYGSLFAADQEGQGGSIYKFAANGTWSTFATNLGAPSGLAFNSSGTLFESDFGGGNNGAGISEFTTNGLESSFITNGLGTPIGIAFDNVILPVTLPVPESSSFPLLVLAALSGVTFSLVRRKNKEIGD